MRHGLTRFRACQARTAVVLGVGILASALGPCRADEWILPDSRLGVRTAPILLLSRPDVQADLKLTTSQVLSAQRAIRSLYERAAALKGQPDSEVIAARRAIDEAQQRWLDAQINDDQRARLFQIDLQWEGPSAVISRPWLATHLGLSTDQRQALSQAVARLETQRNSSTPGQAGGPPDEQALAEEVLSILTPEQRRNWKELLGRPLAIQAVPAVARAPQAR